MLVPDWFPELHKAPPTSKKQEDPSDWSCEEMWGCDPLVGNRPVLGSVFVTFSQRWSEAAVFVGFSGYSKLWLPVGMILAALQTPACFGLTWRVFKGMQNDWKCCFVLFSLHSWHVSVSLWSELEMSSCHSILTLPVLSGLIVKHWPEARSRSLNSYGTQVNMMHPHRSCGKS